MASVYWLVNGNLMEKRAKSISHFSLLLIHYFTFMPKRERG